MKQTPFSFSPLRTLWWFLAGVGLLSVEHVIGLPLVITTIWLMVIGGVPPFWQMVWWLLFGVGVWSLYGLPLGVVLASLWIAFGVTYQVRWGSRFLAPKIAVVIAALMLIWTFILRVPLSSGQVVFSICVWFLLMVGVRWWLVRRTRELKPKWSPHRFWPT